MTKLIPYVDYHLRRTYDKRAYQRLPHNNNFSLAKINRNSKTKGGCLYSTLRPNVEYKLAKALLFYMKAFQDLDEDLPCCLARKTCFYLFTWTRIYLAIGVTYYITIINNTLIIR